MTSRKKAIDEKCKDCIYDRSAPGSWRVQVSLCSCKNCSLWEFRPKTTSAIPETVLAYSGIKPGEFPDYSAKLKTDLETQDQDAPTEGVSAGIDRFSESESERS